MELLRYTVFCLYTVVTFVGGQNPGAEIVVSQKAFDYFVEETNTFLTQRLMTITFPQIHEGGSFASVKLSNMRMSKFSMESINFKPDGTSEKLDLSLKKANIELSGSWEVKSIIGSTGSTFTLGAKGVNLDVKADIHRDTSNIIKVSTTCTSSIQKLEGEIKASTSYFQRVINLLYNALEKTIRSLVNQQICIVLESELQKALNSVKSELRNGVTFDKFTLDYTLVRDAIITDQSLSTEHKGEVYYTTNRLPLPFSPNSCPPAPDNKMISICLTEFILKSFSYSAYNNHYLHYNLTADMLEKGSADVLRTSCSTGTCFGTFFPKVAETFGDSSIKLEIKATEQPILTIDSNGVNMDVRGTVTVFVTTKGIDLTLFRVGVEVGAMFNVSLIDGRLTFIVGDLRTFLREQTNPLTIIEDVKTLNIVAAAASELLVKPRLNALGKLGVKLPLNIENVSILSPSLTLYDGAVLTSFDVKVKF